MNKPPTRVHHRAATTTSRHRSALAGLITCAALLAACTTTDSSSTPVALETKAPSDVVTDGPHVASITPPPIDEEFFNRIDVNTGGAQLSYLRLDTGWHVGTANDRLPRPALSLAKLFIADYVIQTGDADAVDRAVEMIETSSDEIADELYALYPESIDDTATRYQLRSTRGAEQWGYSYTSTYDVVRFVAIKLQDEPDSPIIEAMRHPSVYAADGYRQDFGTAEISGVIGTKWGWSNNLDYHASVSFGENFVIAASLPGSPSDLSVFVLTQMDRIRALEKKAGQPTTREQ